MKIEHKVSITMFSVACALIGIFYTVQKPALESNFHMLQVAKSNEDSGRSLEKISGELESLSKHVNDWGIWDDTYNFALAQNPKFAQSNLRDTFFETTSLDIIVITDKTGKILFDRSRLPDGSYKKIADQINLSKLGKGTDKKPGPLADASGKASGFQSLFNIPSALAVRSIVNSDNNSPTGGMIIMGRFLDEKAIGKLSSQVGVPFKLLLVSELQKEPLTQGQLTALIASQHYLNPPQTERPVVGYHLLKNLEGKVEYYQKFENDSDVLTDGTNTLNQLGLTMALASLLAVGVALLSVHKLIVNPLKSLANKISQIGDDHTSLIDEELLSRTDEIGSLATSFQDSLTRLSATRVRLMQASHEAGMSEVARGILHNAGNVLNSVSISVQHLDDFTSEKNIVGLNKSVKLLKKEQPELGEFFKSDNKGGKLIEYLDSLHSNFEIDRENLQQEILNLKIGVKHLAEIVESQHTLAQKTGQLTEIKAAELVHESFVLLGKSFENHSIQASCEIEKDLLVNCDPVKMMQLLVNLLSNAKDAMESTPLDQRKIHVHGFTGAQGFPELHILDTGKGIEPENLTKIFAQGNSSKSNHLGFGLHYCANVSTEMGWTLSVRSEGHGTGAEFILKQDKQNAAKNAA